MAAWVVDAGCERFTNIGDRTPSNSSLEHPDPGDPTCRRSIDPFVGDLHRHPLSRRGKLVSLETRRKNRAALGGLSNNC